MQHSTHTCYYQKYFCFFLLMKVGNVKAILGVRELKQHKGIFREHLNSILNELVIYK